MNLIQAKCNIPEGSLRTELYKVGPAYRLGNETDIMQEIRDSGPVQGKKKEKKRNDKIFFKIFSFIHTLFFHSHDESLPRLFRLQIWNLQALSYGRKATYWLPLCKNNRMGRRTHQLRTSEILGKGTSYFRTSLQYFE